MSLDTVYEELLFYTKENHGENSQEYIRIIDENWKDSAHIVSMKLMVAFEKGFNNYMKDGLGIITEAMSYEYGLDPTGFIKIEFGPIESSKNIGVTLFHPITNKFYVGELYPKKNNDNRDFTVVSMQEK